MDTNRSVIANITRLNTLMDEHGLAAVVLRSGTNFTYLAGFDYAGTLARHLDFSDSPRGVFVVWPRDGEPALVVNKFAAPRARRDSWLKHIVEVDDYSESPLAAVAKVLHDLNVSGERIGFEKMVISAAHWEELRQVLPEAEVCDCTDLMHAVRWLKTPGEISLIREAARLLDEAYLEVLSGVRDGDTERDIHAQLIALCLHKGANWAHGILNSSRNKVVYGGESDFVFRAGDIVRNDYVLWFNGYPGHQSRTVVVGEASAEQLQCYQTVLGIYRDTVAMARPGVAANAVYRFAADAFADAGFSDRVSIAGHSVGPWWHQQPPYLVPACDTVIEAGMVLAFEPHVNEFHLQDMYLITEDGQENLSPYFSTDEMLVAG